MVQRAADMQITERSIGDTTILDLHGTLYGPDATARLGETIRRLARAGRQQFVVNLANVPSIDAAGLGALVDAYCVVTRNRGTLGLANVTRRASRSDRHHATRDRVRYLRFGGGRDSSRLESGADSIDDPSGNASVVAGVARLDLALPASLVTAAGRALTI